MALSIKYILCAVLSVRHYPEYCLEECYYAEYHFVEWPMLSVILVSDVMLSEIVWNVNSLSVAMVSDVMIGFIVLSEP